MEVKFTASMTTKRKQKATTPAAVSVPRVAPPPRPESAPVGGGGAVVTERTLARQTSDLTPEEEVQMCIRGIAKSLKAGQIHTENRNTPTVEYGLRMFLDLLRKLSLVEEKYPDYIIDFPKVLADALSNNPLTFQHLPALGVPLNAMLQEFPRLVAPNTEMAALVQIANLRAKNDPTANMELDVAALKTGVRARLIECRVYQDFLEWEHEGKVHALAEDRAATDAARRARADVLLSTKKDDRRLLFTAMLFGQAPPEEKVDYLMANANRFELLNAWCGEDERSIVRIFIDEGFKFKGYPAEEFLKAATFVVPSESAVGKVANPMAKALLQDWHKARGVKLATIPAPLLSALFIELAVLKLGLGDASDAIDISGVCLDAADKFEVKAVAKYCSSKIEREQNPAHAMILGRVATDEKKRKADEEVKRKKKEAATEETKRLQEERKAKEPTETAPKTDPDTGGALTPPADAANETAKVSAAAGVVDGVNNVAPSAALTRLEPKIGDLVEVIANNKHKGQQGVVEAVTTTQCSVNLGDEHCTATQNFAKRSLRIVEPAKENNDASTASDSTSAMPEPPSKKQKMDLTSLFGVNTKH